MEVVLRAAVIYVFLWLATKAMGKRELAQLTAFELILLVTMGDLIQQGVTGDDRSVTGAVLAVSTMCILIVVSSLLTFRSARVRDVLEGFAVVVIRDGQPVDDVVRAERLTLDEIRGAAREQGIEDLRRVRVGILEPGGKFSFIVDNGPTGEQTGGQQDSAALS